MNLAGRIPSGLTMFFQDSFRYPSRVQDTWMRLFSFSPHSCPSRDGCAGGAFVEDEVTNISAPGLPFPCPLAGQEPSLRADKVVVFLDENHVLLEADAFPVAFFPGDIVGLGLDVEADVPLVE